MFKTTIHFTTAYNIRDWSRLNVKPGIGYRWDLLAPQIDSNKIQTIMKGDL